MDSIKQPKVTIHKLTAKDAGEAGRFSKSMLNWMWTKYGKDWYPREGIDYDIWDWSPEKIKFRLEDPDFFGFIARSGQSICGIVVGSLFGRSGYAFISWLAVDPKHQHEGIGIRLMTATEEFLVKKECHKIGLYTLPSLVPAIRLHMKFGLLPEAFLRQQWWGADFIVMSKWIGTYKKH